jgi:hypothetical protein
MRFMTVIKNTNSQRVIGLLDKISIIFSNNFGTTKSLKFIKDTPKTVARLKTQNNATNELVQTLVPLIKNVYAKYCDPHILTTAEKHIITEKPFNAGGISLQTDRKKDMDNAFHQLMCHSQNRCFACGSKINMDTRVRAHVIPHSKMKKLMYSTKEKMLIPEIVTVLPWCQPCDRLSTDKLNTTQIKYTIINCQKILDNTDTLETLFNSKDYNKYHIYKKKNEDAWNTKRTRRANTKMLNT